MSNTAVPKGGARIEDLPFGDVLARDRHGGHLPGAVDSIARQTLEVKLAANLGVRPARVGHVVAIERHHVAQDVRRPVLVCRERGMRRRRVRGCTTCRAT